MNPYTRNANRRLSKTFIASLLAYILLTCQLAPMALALNGSAVHKAPTKTTKPIPPLTQGVMSSKAPDNPYAAVPVPLTVSSALLAPSITATKVDTYPSAPGGALPGEIITYNITITNSGPDPATNVTLSDVVDANTVIVGTPKSTPIGFDDAYSVLGNVRIQVPDGAQDLLANDRDPDTDTNAGLTITTLAGDNTAPFAGNSANNGQVTAGLGDGSFQYNPPPGFTGSDTFTYTVTDSDGGTSNGTVTLTVSGMIWFVNSAAGAGGDGRITSPFNCLVGAGCFDPVAADDPGDNIFLFSGNYTGGLTFLANQKLIGQGAGATLASIAGVTVPTFSDALPATGGANPVITTVAAATNALTVNAGGITLRGFTVGNTTGAKIFGNNFGTLTVGNNTTPDMTLNGTGQALNLTTGTFAATSAFTSVTTTSSGTQGINLAGIGGTVAFGSTTISGNTTQGILVGTTTAAINFGNTSVTGGTDGVSFQNNSSGTRTIGTLGVSGGSGSAFIHGAGGGNVNITGAATLSSTGSAVSVSTPTSGNLIDFQAATSATSTGAGNAGVNWAGASGATLTFSALTIQTNAGTGLNASGGGTINVTNGTGTVNNTTQAAPAIVANGVALNANFLSINSSGGTNGVSLTTITGTSNFGAGSLSGAAGATFNVSGGSVSTTYAGNITQANNFAAVNVQSAHTGTMTFNTGTISATNGSGLQFNNADGAYNFNGTTTLNGGGTADTGVDILADSLGTFSFSSNTAITIPTGTAFNVDGLASTSTANVTYSGNITQASNASLLNVNNHNTGTITFNTGTLTATNGNGLQFSNADSTTSYNFNGTTTLNGVDAGVDIITGSNGNFTFASGSSITNPSGTAFNINGGNGNVTYNGTITDDVGLMVSVASTTGGTKSFTGAITDNNDGDGTEQGVSLTSNGGATITFSGGLAIRTTTNAAFTATGGGTVNATQNNTTIVNTLTTTTGTALNVANTNIGASNLTFRSISSNGATNGIILNTTGASGGLVVTGNSAGMCGGSVGAGPPAAAATVTAPVTADCTGGTIQNSTGSGIVLTNTSNVSITRMQVINGGDDGIQGTNVTGFSLISSFFNNNGNANNENGLDFGDSSSITPNGLHGTGVITNSAVQNSFYNGVSIRNNGGAALTSFNVTGSQFRSLPANGSSNDNVFMEAGGTANMAISVTGSHFSSIEGDHFQAAALNSGTLNVNFTNNTLTGGHSTPLGQGITINAATGVPGWNGRVDYDVNGNNITGAVSNGASIVLGTSSAAAVFDGFVRNNVIGTSGVALSCSTQANGVYIDARGNGTHNSSVTSNTIRRCFDRGILTEAGDGDSVLNLTVQSNVIDQQVDDPINTREAIQTNFGITSTNVFGNVDTNVVCLQLGGAGALANTFSHGGGAPDDFRLRKRFEATVRLPGYAGGTDQTPGSLAQVVAFIQGQNTGSAGEPGSASASGAGGGYTGGAACTQPSAPETAIDEIPAPSGIPAETSARDTRQAGTPTGATNSIAARPFISSPRAEIVRSQTAATEKPRVETTVAHPAPAEPAANARPRPVSPPEPVDDPGAKPPVIGPGGSSITWNVGTLPAGRSLTITFTVQVENPYSGPPQVSNQGSISFGGGGGPVLTDDPSVGGATDPTVTPIAAPPDAFIRNARVAEPTSGTTSMLFTVALSFPATQMTTINFNTANGTAVEPGDYVGVTNGSTTFMVGEQLKVIPITVNSDADATEVDENFTVTISANPTVANIVVPTGTGTITVANPPGDALISEIRTSGPAGAGDDFVELYNNSDAQVVVQADDASPGVGLFKMGADCNATPVLIGTIPNGTIIAARAHYLFVGSAYSLSAYATGDQTLTADIEDDRNVGFFSTTDVTSLSTDTRIDAVGFGANTGGGVCDLLREGTNLGAANGSTTQHSFFRRICHLSTPACTTAGTPKDTNDNAADFLFADTAGTLIAGLAQRLGAPGPESLTSPIRRDPAIGAVLLDQSVSGPTVPNRVRDLTSDPGNNSTFGTMSIRRRVVNNTGAPVTRLRFRIIEMSTFPAPSPAGTADLRARTSSLVVVMNVNDAATCTAAGAGPPPCTVNVQGTTLEQPPTQASGGGYNATLAAGTVTMGTPLANGASVNVQFLLGVQQTGTFRFFVIIEALP